jgi:hypothetical protein
MGTSTDIGTSTVQWTVVCSVMSQLQCFEMKVNAYGNQYNTYFCKLAGNKWRNINFILLRASYNGSIRVSCVQQQVGVSL